MDETLPTPRRVTTGHRAMAGEGPRRTEGHTRPCEECGSIEWTTDLVRGEVTCGACGLVAEEAMIDPGAEWTNHSGGDDRSRVGAPTTLSLADKGLNTTINPADLRGAGAARHGLRGQNRRDWARRRVIDDRSKSRSPQVRNLVKAMQYIRRRSELSPQLVEEVARCYRILSEQGYVTGRSIAGVTAACTYHVAREEGIPKQIDDLAAQFEVGRKELARTIRQTSRILGLHTINTPDQYFVRFVNELELEPRIVADATYLWERMKPHTEAWQGKRPTGIAGALIYRAAKERGTPRTQADVCKVAKVSEVTLRGLLRMIDGLFQRLGESGHQ